MEYMAERKGEGMTLPDARRKARASAIRNRDTRYVVFDGPQDGPHGGYQVATEEDMQTFFACNPPGWTKYVFDSTGAEECEPY